MFRAKHAIVSLFAVSAIAVLGTACSDDETAKPQVIFQGSTKELSGKDCRDGAKTQFDVGDFGNANGKPPVASTPVPTGGAWAQGNADVSCSVKPAGVDTFAYFNNDWHGAAVEDARWLRARLGGSDPAG